MNEIAERHDAVLTKPTSKATLPLSFISLDTSYALLPWVASTRGKAISLSPVLRTAPAASLLMKLFPSCCPGLVAGLTLKVTVHPVSYTHLRAHETRHDLV